MADQLLHARALAPFWMRSTAANLRAKGETMRAAYRTPFMTQQTDAYADACELAAKLMDAAAADYERKHLAPPAQQGVARG